MNQAVNDVTVAINDSNILQEIGGNGLDGYIDTWYNTDIKYQYGSSFYNPVWSLLKTPLSNYQIGLPSTWIIPNNDDFKQPLCPKGTYARDNWPDRGPTWSEVFQTMEGGLGYWGDVAFPVGVKFRMGGTPDCYTYMVSSSSWAGDQILPPKKMGIAQFSNSIIFPPDGLTFAPGTNGQQFGQAYMPIPMLPKQTTPQPTGNLSWTLFLNAKNFKGPIASYIPNYWSNLSQGYATISGRCLDARPGKMDTIGMEVNTVPYFTAQDKKGNTYTRIPALQFPVDSNGYTILAQGVRFYTADAFFNPLANALKNNTNLPTTFNSGIETSMQPNGSLDPFSFTQTNDNLPITGLEKTVQTFAKTKNDPSAYGLKWVNIKGTGAFPEYFMQQGKNMVAIAASAVPVETNLQKQVFTPATIGSGYKPPKNFAKNNYWNNWVKNQPAVKVTLNDGSVVTYRWYRFVDQPAIAGLNLNNAQKNALQNLVIKLHKGWSTQPQFMPDPPTGDLATLDPALLVKPPSGLEYGYVPVVLEQIAAPKTQTFMFDAQKISAPDPVIPMREEKPVTLKDSLRLH